MINIGWEGLKYRSSRCRGKTSEASSDGAQRELVPDFLPNEDTEIGFAATVLAPVVPFASFELVQWLLAWP